MTTMRQGGPPAAGVRAATVLACQSASWLPRVPIRSSVVIVRRLVAREYSGNAVGGFDPLQAAFERYRRREVDNRGFPPRRIPPLHIRTRRDARSGCEGAAAAAPVNQPGRPRQHRAGRRGQRADVLETDLVAPYRTAIDGVVVRIRWRGNDIQTRVERRHI